MKEGAIQPAALKKVAYNTPGEIFKAHAELAALKDAEGCPYFSQCMAVQASERA